LIHQIPYCQRTYDNQAGNLRAPHNFPLLEFF
jgi:hypothetical protein